MSGALQPFTFRGKVAKVYDGDTVWLELERGEGWSSKGKYRLYGADTPELRSTSSHKVTAEEKVYAIEAREYVNDVLRDKVLVVSTRKGKSKYDWLAEIYWYDDELRDYQSLAAELIRLGHAVPYIGGAKAPWKTRKAAQDAARELVEVFSDKG